MALQLLGESLQLLEGLLHGGLVAEARLRRLRRGEGGIYKYIQHCAVCMIYQERFLFISNMQLRGH